MKIYYKRKEIIVVDDNMSDHTETHLPPNDYTQPTHLKSLLYIFLFAEKTTTNGDEKQSGIIVII